MHLLLKDKNLVKFGFSEKATKFGKIFAQQGTCQKVDEDFSK